MSRQGVSAQTGSRRYECRRNAVLRVGVYRGFAVSAVFSRRRFQSRFSRTADFQRSRWDNIREDAGFPQTPASDTGEQARTGKSRQFSRITRTSPPRSQPPLPPPTLTTASASADASADTDAVGGVWEEGGGRPHRDCYPGILRGWHAVETGFHICTGHVG